MIRNAQEKRQLDNIAGWLSRRGYREAPLADPNDPSTALPGTYSFRTNIEGWVDERGATAVTIPVDVVVKSRHALPEQLPLFVEAKSAGDFTNVNKRRKEEAVKATQLRRRHGPDARLVLFLGGYFDTGYLEYEAAEGIDWVWEHRIDDFLAFGL